MLAVKSMIDLSVIDFGEEKCAPGHSYGPEVRSYYLIHYVTAGKGSLTINNHTWEVNEGQSFLIYPGEVTFYQADFRHPWHYIWIGCMGEAAQTAIQLTNFSRSQRVLTVSHPDEAWKTLTQMNIDIKTLHLGELATLGALFRFLSLLSSAVNDNVVLNLTQYEKAVHYMQENFPRAVTVQEVADAVNLSRSQLYRIFENACGESPKHVLEQMKLAHAKHLLRMTNLPVEEIARAAGFGSSSYLNKAFQKYRGLSPSAYRAYRKSLAINAARAALETPRDAD